MDEASRQQPQDEQYARSLETIVKSRTEQPTQSVSANEKILEHLKQIQSMESLEQVQEAIQTRIEKFAPQPTRPPNFGGEAGEPVPEVDKTSKQYGRLGQK
jgi:ATPase subunit of ABC transporter with duplicated ATPase domains